MKTSFYNESSVFVGVILPLALLVCIVMKFFGISAFMKTIPGVKNVLLVTAHPDDECMFFGPVLVELAKSNEVRLNLLCLSTGNYEGIGPTRKLELWNSCKLLGIPESHITCVNHSNLPDDPDIGWRPADISMILIQNLIGLQIDTLITFDDYGVSGHINHISIQYCVDQLMRKGKIPTSCRVYTLESVNWLRKYLLGSLDVLLSYATSNYMYTTDEKGTQRIRAAMEAHVSQYVWYRKLYVLFSRYVRVNTFKQVRQPSLKRVRL